MLFFIFCLFPVLLCSLRWVLPVGAVRVKRSCVPDSLPRASDGVWEVNSSGMCSMWPRCSCHPLHFLMRFVPLLIEVMDLRYGGGEVMDGRWKEGYPWPSQARLTLLHVPFEDWGWARTGVVSRSGYAPCQGRISLSESCSFFPKHLSSSSLGTVLAWAAARGSLCFPALCFSVQEHLSWHSKNPVQPLRYPLPISGMSEEIALF